MPRARPCAWRTSKASGRLGKARTGETGFNTKQYSGSLSLVPVPPARNCRASPRRRWRICVIRCSRRPRCRRARASPPARARARRRTERLPARHLHHQGKPHLRPGARRRDGRQRRRRSLCIFGERVTPNQHKLVREFVAAGQHLLLRHSERRRPSMGRQRHRHGLRGARVRRLAAQLSRRR